MTKLIDLIIQIPASSQYNGWTALDLNRFNSYDKVWKSLIWVTRNVNASDFNYSYPTNTLYVKDSKKAALLVLSV